ncbi:MAG: phosphoglucomutase/phosphomannomutase family protein [Anaerolineae bacterium]|nr:phosphoglucomutase/phosphomannomutase family protein [Anaerolineae bacterium]NUQ03271.1 phosphoglucomutase/phosphomannomutase family protein [Anaerolineae bacterium]
MIRFGTDGWRAVIADTFTFANLRQVSQAVADYVNKAHTGSEPPQVIVGYDTRFLSDRFAMETARVLAGNDIVTWLTRTDTPTPAVSYNVKHLNANAGVVITASHNPPRYNGFKLKAAYGGSATAEQCQLVEEEMIEMERQARGPNIMDYQHALEAGLIRRFDPSWSYYQHLATLVDLDKVSEGELKIVVDAMWGAGRGAFPSILARTRSRITEIRGTLNPGFGGIHPEPIMRHLNELVAAVQREQADVGLATDGDADRIGAIDARGNFVDPHHVLALALRYLVEVKKQRGDVVKTISTTMMVDALANKHDLKLHVTPVGFNHIADLMMHGDVLIGGEESGGISMRGHIPEGDGILMGLLILEIMAHYRAPLHEIVADLQAHCGPAHYARIDVHLEHQRPKKLIVSLLEEHAPEILAGERIARIDKLDGIKFILSDGSWLLIRPSGTEPVLRIYAEARSPEMVKALLDAGSDMGHRVTE